MHNMDENVKKKVTSPIYLQMKLLLSCRKKETSSPDTGLEHTGFRCVKDVKLFLCWRLNLDFSYLKRMIFCR